MKKKIVVLMMLAVTMVGLTACSGQCDIRQGSNVSYGSQKKDLEDMNKEELEEEMLRETLQYQRELREYYDSIRTQDFIYNNVRNN